jgi:hypothetical protein
MTPSKVAHVKIGAARNAAGRDYRAGIEALLERANSKALADLWQKVCPFPVDKLPERQAVIADLADFAEQLQPRLADMRAEELCRLIEKYACPRQARAEFCEAPKPRPC